MPASMVGTTGGIRGRAIACALAGLAAFACGAVLAPSASAAKKDKAEGLYVLSAQSGELDRAKNGKRAFRLLIRDPQGDVTSFTDRPERRAGHMKLGSFIRRWNRLGFKRVPPNAALVIAAAPGSRDVLVVELSKPKLLRGDRLAFRAEVLKGSATGALHRFHKRADKRVAASFGEFSLFIDPSGEPVSISLDLKNVNGLQGFAVGFRNATLSGLGGGLLVSGAADIEWSADGFRIVPKVVAYPNPGAPVDAEVALLVDADSSVINGHTEMPAGGTGTMRVLFKNSGGFDDCYRVPIYSAFGGFSLPVDGTIPPDALPGPIC